MSIRLKQLPGDPVRRPSKYRAVRTQYRGVWYDSKGEAGRAATLDAMQAAGEILWWIGQPKFRLGCPENVYVADFLVVTAWATRVEDFKGVRTAKFNRDVKLWGSYGPCELHVVSSKATQVVIPNGMGKGA